MVKQEAWALCALLTLVGCGVVHDATYLGLQGSSDNNSRTTGTGPRVGNCLDVAPTLSLEAPQGTLVDPPVALALDANGAPLIAYSSGTAAQAQPVRAAILNQKAWQPFDTSTTAASGNGPANGGPSLAVGPTGQVVLGWPQFDPGRIVFKKFTAADATGGGVSLADMDLAAPSVRLVLLGDVPLVAWSAISGTQRQVDFVVFRDATTEHPTPLATSTTALSTVEPLSVVSNGTSVAVAATTGAVQVATRAADGNFVFGASPPVAKATRSVLVMRSSGDLVLAWEDISGKVPNIYVQLFTGGSWIALGPPPGGARLGASDSATGAQHPALALDAQGQPVLAWEDVATRQVHLRAWNGTAWTALGTSAQGVGVSAAAQSASWPALAVSPTDFVLAWVQDGTQVRVCTWSRATPSAP